MFGKIKRQGGFTLVELMICIAIIGILAAIAIPNYISYRERGMVAHAQAELKSLEKVITVLVLDSGCYPDGYPVEEFDQGGPDFYLSNAPRSGLAAIDNDFLDCMAETGGYWAGPYMKNVPKDPWGNDYWFDGDWNNREDGWDYVAIGSNGPDGVGKNDYDDPDNIVLTISDPYVDPD